MEQEDVEEQRQDEKKSNSSASVDGDSDVGDGYENVPDRDTEEEGMADKSSSEENLDEMVRKSFQCILRSSIVLHDSYITENKVKVKFFDKMKLGHCH